MRSVLTDITLVVDRSGSMQQIRGDAEGEVNSFIEQQANEPGEALLTLGQYGQGCSCLHGDRSEDLTHAEAVWRGETVNTEFTDQEREDMA